MVLQAPSGLGGSGAGSRTARGGRRNGAGAWGGRVRPVTGSDRPLQRAGQGRRPGRRSDGGRGGAETNTTALLPGVAEADAEANSDARTDAGTATLPPGRRSSPVPAPVSLLCTDKGGTFAAAAATDDNTRVDSNLNRCVPVFGSTRRDVAPPTVVF